MSGYGNLMVADQVQMLDNLYAKKINFATPQIVSIPTSTTTQIITPTSDCIIVDFVAGTAVAQEVKVPVIVDTYSMMDFTDEGTAGDVIHKHTFGLGVPGGGKYIIASRANASGSGTLPAGRVVIRLFGVNSYKGGFVGG